MQSGAVSCFRPEDTRKEGEEAENAIGGRAPVSSFSFFIFLEHEKFQIYFLNTHAHVYYVYAKFHSIIRLHVAYRKKTNTHFLMGLLFLLLGQKFVIFVQPTNHNIFRRNLTRSCGIHISFHDIFLDFFGTFKYTF